MWCVAGAVIASVGAVITSAITSSVPVTQMGYPYTPNVFRATEALWTIAHALMLVGTIALARSGLAGSGRLARAGAAVAITGMALVVPSELGFALIPTAATDSTAANALGTAIGLSVVTAGIGFILLGSAVLRNGRWQGWGRYTPLLAGAFVFLVLIPVQFARPSIFLWPVAGWSACFILLGVALHQRARPVGADGR